MNDLASMLFSQGDLTAARVLQEQVRALHREVIGERHPGTLISMSNLTQILFSQGDLTAARVLQEQVLALRREVLGEGHLETSR